MSLKDNVSLISILVLGIIVLLGLIFINIYLAIAINKKNVILKKVSCMAKEMYLGNFDVKEYGDIELEYLNNLSKKLLDLKKAIKDLENDIFNKGDIKSRLNISNEVGIYKDIRSDINNILNVINADLDDVVNVVTKKSITQDKPGLRYIYSSRFLNENMSKKN